VQTRALSQGRRYPRTMLRESQHELRQQFTVGFAELLVKAMSAPLHTFLIIGGIFLLVFGYWFAWRRYSLLLEKRRPGAKAMGEAILALASFALIASGIRTDVGIDAWSAIDKLIGASLLALLWVAGIQVGIAFRTAQQLHQQKGSAREA